MALKVILIIFLSSDVDRYRFIAIKTAIVQEGCARRGWGGGGNLSEGLPCENKPCMEGAVYQCSNVYINSSRYSAESIVRGITKD